VKFSKLELEAAAKLVHQYADPTSQLNWPLLDEILGVNIIVKHENQLPTGAFKVRGGITFIDWIKREHKEVRGIVTATRGNHGQSQAMSAKRAGLSATIYVPKGNSSEKNAAMAAFGADVREYGSDFDEAKAEAMRQAELNNWYPVPPFHKEIIRGVATYAYELFSAKPDLDIVYVPIGCGSGICGTILARDALGLSTKIIGVVSSEAQGAKLSFEQGKLVETNSANTFADGLAVRVPVAEAFEIYSKGAERIISVNEEEIASAIRLYFSATHNASEGAGAAALAGLMQEKKQMQGKKVGVILSGANIDSDMLHTVLGGGVPKVISI
jgi:threonine dehydratase